jgi:hypothetical protein
MARALFMGHIGQDDRLRQCLHNLPMESLEFPSAPFPISEYSAAIRYSCNTRLHMNSLSNERLTTLTEIAHDCFGIESLSPVTTQPELRYSVCVDDIVRALESAYDIGLIVGSRLHQTLRVKP